MIVSACMGGSGWLIPGSLAPGIQYFPSRRKTKHKGKTLKANIAQYMNLLSFLIGETRYADHGRRHPCRESAVLSAQVAGRMLI